MNRVLFLALSIATLAGTGCASITGSELQSVMVSTTSKSGEPVVDAECQLQNPKGIWKVKTPSAVAILRASEDMDVECRKGGQIPGVAKLISRAHGGMFGNIIFGGGIGAIIDHNKGTGYEYPNVVSVIMGDTVLIDRNHEIAREQMAIQGQPPAPTGAPAPAPPPVPAPGCTAVPGGQYSGVNRC